MSVSHFNWLLEKEPEPEEAPEEEEEEEEEGEVEPPIDEQTLFYNREITQCFDLFDRGGGKMETRHFARALECLGLHVNPIEVEEVQEQLDSNGIITLEKFHTYAFDKLLTADQTEALRDAFHTFDPERDGYVNSERFKRYLTTLGDPLSEKEAKDFIKMGDRSGRGIFFYEELPQVLLKG